MRVLLLSMPDSFEHTPPIAMRMPNGALASLAGNVDPHHQRRRRRSHPRAGAASARRSSGWCASSQPDVVGLSVMTFQRAHGAAASSRCIRALRPDGAHRRRRLRPEPRARGLRRTRRCGVDFIVRGEGELTFRELLRALERGATLRRHRRALSFRDGDGFRHNPARPVSAARGRRRSAAEPRARACSTATRCSAGQVDVVETSRGCTFDCSFCSIIEMRGRNFHTLPIRARARRHRATRARAARGRSSSSTTTSRSTSRGSRRCAAAIVDAGLQRHRLHRAGDDVVDRQPRRDAGAADAAGRLPLRVPRHRERARRGPRVPQRRARRTRSARAGGTIGQRDAARRSSICTAHGMYVVGGLIVGNPGRHARVDRGQPRVRAALRRLAVHPASDAVSAARR